MSKDKCRCKGYKCMCKYKERYNSLCSETNTIYSAFRADTSGSLDQILDGTLPVEKVFFKNEIFDIENEYDSSTSTFTAKHSGVYHFIASLHFLPLSFVKDFQVRVQIFVNGSVNAADVEFQGTESSFTLGIEINSIVQLNAGDYVEVFASSTIRGILVQDLGNTFAGARFPSPVE
ncbi:ABC transporter permease [Lysinibacillus sp. 1 U-2021]|uniref:C1q-like domain-containing protein n=1 Tax=Lysinibacillus sp. 1 U-2021 TaxID=3039426 RepID=UPI002481488E|nr:ABC transporter permease [Lysinibacillus sp. 1 U-2021]WGT41434.1 ABC transporter permease [Lysinibacillus sp. 1 U-2021]